jgi:peptidyl-prolyl cis-trans isomerase B (cyclophilin B)
MNRLRRALVLGVCVAALGAGQSSARQDLKSVREMRRAMLAAEDGRPLTRKQAAPLLNALSSGIPAIQRAAVRALGRLEDPQFAEDLTPYLAAASPEVRAEAANALGQIAANRIGPPPVALIARLSAESDDMVRGVLCETLGRLPFAAASDMQRLEPVLVESARAAKLAESRVRAIKGIEALLRRGWSKQLKAAEPTVEYLAGAAEPPVAPGSGSDEAPVRRAALMALAAGRLLGKLHLAALGDPDPQVRRLAIVALLPDLPFDPRAVMVARALKDSDAMVRYEALRVHGRHLARTSCAAEVAALDDPNPHVRLVAIDQTGLAGNCRDEASTTAALAAVARALRPRSPAVPSPDWQGPAHALVSLARRNPADAAPLLSGFASHAVWQVRMYAARAADALGDAAALTNLAADDNANVREAALAALVRVKGRDADAALVAALGRPSYQVARQAALGLKGTSRREEATAALLKALETITARRHETSRDTRLAILDRIQELGYAHQAPSIERYVNDFDPAVARRAADTLTEWTGRSWDPLPRRTAGAPSPTPEDIDALPPGLRITLSGGRSFDVRFMDDAPITAWRVTRLVKAGYYNGLTFHRIIPGFIVQGGSPDANEYVGDGPFMRDELGLRTNARGTIGTSTRGRDTGDAQFYVNLVDNPRLDHEYTVFAEVTRGMDVVDSITEGDVMVSVEPLPAPPAARKSPGPRPHAGL